MRVIAITGAGRGIGREIARRFAAAGDRLALGYHDGADRLEQLADEHPDGREAVMLSELDVTNRADAAAFVEAAERSFGQLDVLVTNAGIHRHGASADVAWSDWDDVLSVNLTGTFACVRAALPGMLARGSGRIITISSELGLVGMARNAAYCASKGGVIALTKALALECAPHGVLVNSVAPGPVLTDMLTESPEYADESALASVPLGRYGTPEEIGAVVELLAGEAGSFMVGQIVSPNGGAVT